MVDQLFLRFSLVFLCETLTINLPTRDLSANLKLQQFTFLLTVTTNLPAWMHINNLLNIQRCWSKTLRSLNSQQSVVLLWATIFFAHQVFSVPPIWSEMEWAFLGCQLVWWAGSLFTKFGQTFTTFVVLPVSHNNWKTS